MKHEPLFKTYACLLCGHTVTMMPRSYMGISPLCDDCWNVLRYNHCKILMSINKCDGPCAATRSFYSKGEIARRRCCGRNKDKLLRAAKVFILT